MTEEELEVVVFNDKSWVKLTEFQRLEKEKCELLGIIQKKDELIRKMKCCDRCKHWLKGLEMEILDKSKDELREPCNVCNNYDKWEIRI